MACSRKTKTNGNKSLLFDTLFDIVKDEDYAHDLYAELGTKDFKNIFGDYEANYKVKSGNNYDFELGARTDVNGEPKLIYNEDLGKHYFLDKENEKVYFPYSDVGLNQFFEINDIKTFAKTIALSFYKENVNFNYDNLTFKIKSSLKQFVKDFIDTKTSELMNSSDPSHKGMGIALKNTSDNTSEWMREVEDFFASINIEYDPNQDDINEAEQAKSDLMRKESMTVSALGNVNKNIKLYLSLIQNDTLNNFNEYDFVPFNDIFSTLNKTLNNLVANIDNNELLFDIQLEKIKELIKVKPYLFDLYDKLNNTNISDSFKNQFSSTFNLFKNNYLISEIYTDENGNVHYDVKNLTDTGSRKLNYLNQWNFTYKTILGVNSAEAKIEVTKAESALNKEINKITSIDGHLTNLKKVLGKLGIPATDKALRYLKNGLSTEEQSLEDDIQFILNSYDSIRRALKEADDNIENDNNVFADQSFFSRLAEAEAFFKEEGTDASIFSLGKSKWFFSNPSHLDIRVAQWQNNPKQLIDHYESTDYYNGSHYMEYLSASKIENYEERVEESKKRLAKVKVAVFNSVQTKNDSINGFDNKNITYTDSLVDYINKGLAFRKGRDTYHKTALAGDKATEYQISFGNNEDYFTLSADLEYKDGIHNTSDKILEIFYKYYKSEYKRIGIVYDEIQNGEGNIPNYHTGATNGLKSQLLPSLSDNSVIKLFSVEGKPLYENLDEIKGDIKDHINLKLNDLIIKNYNLLLDNQVFVYNENGVRENKLVDNNIYEYYKNNTSNPNMIFYNIAADFLINSLVSQVEYSKMFTGDIAYYKDFADYQKRVASTYTDGKYLNNLSLEEGSFNISVISGVEIGYQDMTALKEVLSEEVYAYYENNINDTDAQAWITPERWMFIMHKLGKDSKSVKDLYKKMHQDNPQFSPKELELLAQPLKGVYFDITDGVPRYLKYSQAVLLPNLIKGTQLEKLYNKMKGSAIDEVVTRDGIKVGYTTPTTTHDANGNVLDEFDLSNSIITLNNANWKLQQDLPTKGIKDTDVGSQIQKNIFQGLIHGNAENEFYLGNSTFNGTSLTEEINSIIHELSNQGVEVAKQKLGLNDNFEITNTSVLYKNIIKQLKARSDSNPNLIKALQAGTSPYGIPGGVDIFQNVFSKLINKNAVKISTNGGGFIQMANYGLNAENAKNQNIIYTPWFDKNNLPMPELYTDENGRKRLKPSGIFISGSFIAKVFPGYKNESVEKLFGTAENNYTDGIIDKRILENIIGYRIPNQGLASNDALQILGILPDEIGDTVIAYTGITTKTGSDFDIDKMYLMIPSFDVEKENYNEVKAYVNSAIRGKTVFKTVNNVLDLMDKLDPDETSFDIKPEDFAKVVVSTDEGLKGTLDFYLKQLSALLTDYNGTDAELLKLKEDSLKTRVSKLSYVVYDESKSHAEQSNKALKNRLIEAYKSVLISRHNIDEVFTPIDLDFMENDVKSLLPIEEKDDLELFSGIEDLKTKNEFILAKAGLGQNVNSLVDSVRGSMANLSLNETYVGMGIVNEKGDTTFDMEHSEKLTNAEMTSYLKTYNKKIDEYNATVKEEKNKKSKLTRADLNKLQSIKLSTAMTVLANGFVDVAKDSYIAKGNWVTQTNNVGFMLLRSGTHLFKVNALLNQPFIKDFIKFRSNMESNSINDTSNLFTRFLLKQVHNKVSDEIGDASITLNGKTFTYNNLFKSILTTDMVVNHHLSKGKKKSEAYDKLIANLKIKIAKKFGVTKKDTDANRELKDGLIDLLDTMLLYHDSMFQKATQPKDALSLVTLRKEALGEQSNTNQLFYLKYFNELTDHAKQLSKNVKASKIDVEGKGKDINSTIIYNNIIKNILANSSNEGALNGFESKLEFNGKPTILKTYLDNSVGFAYKVMSNNPSLFLTASPNVIKTFNVVSKYVYDEYLENEQLGKALEKSYYSYVMSSFPALQMTKAEKKDIIKTLPEKFAKLREEYRVEEEDSSGSEFARYTNILLQELYVNSTKDVDFISMNNIKKDASHKNDITDGWRYLLEVEPEFAEDLIKYSFIISGFNNSISQFHEFIPYEWFNRNRFNAFLKSFNRGSNGIDTNFINQFFRNNLKNYKYSKRVFRNMLNPEFTSESSLAIKKDASAIENRNTLPYILRYDVSVGMMGEFSETRFYKLEGEVKGDNYIYTRVEPLSYKDNKGNKFVEYISNNDYNNATPYRSMFQSNHIKTDSETINHYRNMFNSLNSINEREVDEYVDNNDHLDEVKSTEVAEVADEATTIQSIWEAHQDAILEKNPDATLESLLELTEGESLEDITDYLKKCYNLPL